MRKLFAVIRREFMVRVHTRAFVISTVLGPTLMAFLFVFPLLLESRDRAPKRIVVIDAPPPALAAETSVLARQVDGVLVVVRYESTRRNDLADLVAQVGEKKILGSIVNCIETAASRYYGYKYGSYGRRKDR